MNNPTPKLIDLGVLRTMMLQDHSADTPTGGVFELKVQVDQDLFMKDPDKFGMCRSAIAQHLAVSTHTTEVPTSAWQFVSNDFMIKNYHFPAVVSFARKGRT